MKRRLILENIRSIHNVGAFFRSADGAGFDEIFLCGYSPTPDDARIAKVALGAERSIWWQHFPDALSAISFLRETGSQIWAMETGPSAENLFSLATAPANMALVFGHEVDGISAEALALCDRICFLPMRGQKESLNVSVAGGVAMYEIMRKRRQ